MRVLGIVFVALVCALSFGGSALAHSPVHHEPGAVHGYPHQSVHGKNSRSIPAVGERDRTEAALSSAAFAASRDTGGLNDTSSDVDLDDDCCGVACHAAIGGRNYDNRPSQWPLSALIVVEASLFGRSPGRLERPPRVL